MMAPTAEQLVATFRAMLHAEGVLNVAFKYGNEDDKERAKRAASRACERWSRICARAAQSFAQGRGWTVSRGFHPSRLMGVPGLEGVPVDWFRADGKWMLFDHASHFLSRRRPVSVVAHLHAPVRAWRDIQDHARALGLRATRLGPECSWYAPEVAELVVLYVRAATASSNLQRLSRYDSDVVKM